MPGKDPLEDYINNFVTKSRLKMTPKIHHESMASDPFEYLEKHSAKADLTFLCLEHFEKKHTHKEYANYLKKVLIHPKGSGIIAYVICFDQVDHCELYYYPQG